jgi:hypothetical protein
MKGEPPSAQPAPAQTRRQTKENRTAAEAMTTLQVGKIDRDDG